MRRSFVLGLAGLLFIIGCAKRSDTTAADSSRRGRYVGVGIYSPGAMWSQIVVANQSKDPSESKLNDDDQVIVVLDSNTGELRQCGNLSGYCIGMNPWAKPLGASQIAPLPVAKHAEELQDETAPVAKPNAAVARGN
jgi:hypothetical protein